QLRHLAIKECQEKCPDVGTVHVRIGHDDDPAVPQFFEIEGAFAVSISDSGADSRDHRLDFEILQHLVESGFLDIDEFPSDRKNRLKSAVAPLLSGSSGGIAFYD